MRFSPSAVAIIVFGFAVGAAQAQLTDPFLIHKTPATDRVFLEALRGTLWVGSLRKTGDMQEVRLRSGFLIDKENRLAVTQYSALSGEGFQVKGMTPTFPGGMLENNSTPYKDQLEKGEGIAATVIATAPKSDLAIIQLEKLPDDAKSLRLAKGAPRAGQRVLVVCAAYSTKEMWTYSPGIIAGAAPRKWHDAGLGDPGFDFDCRVIQTEHFLDRGQMGGPVVNERGEVVAMHWGASAEGGTIHIDASEIRTLLASKEVVAVTKRKPDAEPEKTAKPGKPPVVSAEERLRAKAEQAAAAKLRLARSLMKANKKESARQRCEELLKAYPETAAAEEAKKLLAELEM